MNKKKDGDAAQAPAPAPVAVESPKKDKETESLLAKKLAVQAKIMKRFALDGGDGGRVVEAHRKAIEFYPTGIEPLDHEVFGIGGVPRGKVMEIYGTFSSGKTATALHICARVQALNPTATVKIYDAEDAWTDEWGQNMGLDLNRTLLPDFTSAESMGSQIQADLASEYPPEIILIDSLAALLPEGMMEKEIADKNMRDNMGRAQYLTDLWPMFVRGFFYPPRDPKSKAAYHGTYIRLGRTPTCIIAINHAKPGLPQPGDKPGMVRWKTVGGVSTGFYSAIRLNIKRTGYIEESGIPVQQKVLAVADKNKLAPPKRECEMILSFKGGMTQMAGLDYLAIALEKKLAEKNGSWISSQLLPNGRIQGEEAFNKFADGNPEIKKLLLSK